MVFRDPGGEPWLLRRGRSVAAGALILGVALGDAEIGAQGLRGL